MLTPTLSAPGPSAEELRQREGTTIAPAAISGPAGQVLTSDGSLLADILSGAQPIPRILDTELRPQNGSRSKEPSHEEK